MIVQLWNELENTLKNIDSPVNKDLLPPASDADIFSLENKLNIKLPEDFKQSLKVHNGQLGNELGIINGLQMLSTESIICEWSIWKELYLNGDFDTFNACSDKEIQNTWWDNLWIPITSDGSGNHICIDLNPTPKGNKGQIIQIWHDYEKREILDSSFEIWFKNSIQKILGK